MATRIARRSLDDELATPQVVKRLFGEHLSKRLGEWLGQREEVVFTERGTTEPKELDGTWPIRLPLETLTEARAMKDVSAVRQWVQSWEMAKRELPDGVQVQWESRQWRLLGQQQIPIAVEVRDVLALTAWTGQEQRWRQACARRDEFEDRFPRLRLASPWARYEEVVTTWSREDFRRLMDLLQWFEVNSTSMLYQRQLPVPGIDTKWLDSRRGLVRDFVLASRGQVAGGDFYEVCGLRPAPATLRMRVLCPELRRVTGGLCDVEGPIEELAQLQLRPKTLLIVENLASGIALPSMPGTVAFMKLGHAVSELTRIPWLFANMCGTGGPERVLYWGDLDTHGFVILSRARAMFPALRSVLMDEQTLMGGKEQWVVEASQAKVAFLERLTPQEQALYKALREQVHGPNVRLEQERLAWPLCLKALHEVMS